jgi:hypothetical protein
MRERGGEGGWGRGRGKGWGGGGGGGVADLVGRVGGARAHAPRTSAHNGSDNCKLSKYKEERGGGWGQINNRKFATLFLYTQTSNIYSRSHRITHAVYVCLPPSFLSLPVYLSV